MRMEGCLELTVDLPVGLKVGEEVFNSVIVREIVGFDEEAVSQPQFKNNPAGGIQELIYRCVAEVPGTTKMPSRIDLKKLPVGILDFLVLKIREVSVGTVLEEKVRCEECKKEIETIWDTSGIGIKGEHFTPFDLTLDRGIRSEGVVYKTVRIKPLSGFSQEKFASIKDLSRFGELATDMLMEVIESADGKKIDKASISGMVKADRKKIAKELLKLPRLDTEVEIECPHCKNVFKHNLGIIDFLL